MWKLPPFLLGVIKRFDVMLMTKPSSQFVLLG
jgi:hypothetical protein